MKHGAWPAVSVQLQESVIICRWCPCHDPSIGILAIRGYECWIVYVACHELMLRLLKEHYDWNMNKACSHNRVPGSIALWLPYAIRTSPHMWCIIEHLLPEIVSSQCYKDSIFLYPLASASSVHSHKRPYSYLWQMSIFLKIPLKNYYFHVSTCMYMY